MKAITLSALFILFISSISVASDIYKIGLEPVPPLIYEDGSGFSIEFLKEIQKKSGIKFDIEIMSYNRARIELKKGRIDMMGHTPFKNEAKDFYNFAQDIEWSIPIKIDIYSLEKEKLAPETYKLNKKIGTPTGNELLFSEMLEIPLKNFYTRPSYDMLLKMLSRKSIDMFLFLRGSAMPLIQKMNIKNVYYRMVSGDQKAGFAVSKNSRGSRLKKQFEQTLNEINHQKYFISYYNYMNLPEQGIVNVY